jgi:hypothetical protein
VSTDRGSAGGSYSTDTSQTATLIFTWTGVPSTTISRISVLTADANGASVAYGAVANVVVQDGTSTTLPSAIQPAPVGVTGNLTAAVQLVNVPPSWGYARINVGILDGNGALFALQSAVGPSLVQAIPNVPGGSVRVAAQATDPANPNGWASANVTVPLTATSATVSVPGAPRIVAPVNGGTMSVTDHVAWIGTMPSTIYDSTVNALLEGGEERIVATVVADSQPVDFARLTLLGVDLPLGRTHLTVSGLGAIASLDALVDEQTVAEPDGSSRTQADVTFTLAP